jgi:glycosyltransferase involved in cell wall biosynthesis
MNNKICFPFAGDTLGGSHISAIELIKFLKKNDFIVSIVLHKKGNFSKYLDKEGINFQLLKIDSLAGDNSSKINIIYLLLKNFNKIRKFIKLNNIDLVHGNDLRINLQWGFVSLFYCYFIWHQRTYYKNRSLLFIPMYFLANNIISISKTVKNSLPKILLKKNHVIYNPIKTFSKKKNEIKKKLNICFVSRPTNEKGFHIFMDIVKNLEIFGIDIKYNVYLPNGKKNIHIKNNKIQFKNNKILFHNFTSFKNIAKNNNILIAPSKFEGFGRSIIEAASCNIAVIASNIKAHQEINNRFVKVNIVPNRYENYVECIKKIVVKKKITSKSIVKLKTFFSPLGHYKSVFKIYQKLIKD